MAEGLLKLFEKLKAPVEVQLLNQFDMKCQEFRSKLTKNENIFSSDLQDVGGLSQENVGLFRFLDLFANVIQIKALPNSTIRGE